MITPCIDIIPNLRIGVLKDMYIKPLKGQSKLIQLAPLGTKITDSHQFQIYNININIYLFGVSLYRGY